MATRELVLQGQSLTFRIDRTERGVVVNLDGQSHEYDVQELGSGRLILGNSSGRMRARVARSRDRIWVWVSGRTFEFQVPSSEHGGDHRTESGNDVRAPMPGLLVKLSVAEGEYVEQGQVVAVVEAMKMEHQLRAPRSGRVAKISGSVGSQVDADTAIVVLEETN